MVIIVLIHFVCTHPPWLMVLTNSTNNPFSFLASLFSCIEATIIRHSVGWSVGLSISLLLCQSISFLFLYFYLIFSLFFFLITKMNHFRGPWGYLTHGLKSEALSALNDNWKCHPFKNLKKKFVVQSNSIWGFVNPSVCPSVRLSVRPSVRSSVMHFSKKRENR